MEGTNSAPFVSLPTKEFLKFSLISSSPSGCSLSLATSVAELLLETQKQKEEEESWFLGGDWMEHSLNQVKAFL